MSGARTNRPAQLRPSQLPPAQLRPAQLRPAQERPAHAALVQDPEAHDRPDQTAPFQLPSVHAAARSAAAACAVLSKGTPMTSRSPSSGTPSSTSRRPPRAASREPVPLDRTHFCAAPTGVAADRVRSVLSRPRPCACGSAALSGAAPPRNSDFTWSGVRPGRCCSRSAAAPDTTAAAWLVPLPRKKRSPSTAFGFCVSMKDPGTRSDWTDAPGATRSGLRVPSPRVEKSGMTSSFRPIVPLASSAPTAITYGSCAGLSSLPVPVPSLPADTTTTSPRCQACSAACARGSSR